VTTTADRAKFARWLEQQVISEARGDGRTILESRPDKLLWLGRVASAEAAWRSATTERLNRLDPCSIGFRFRPRSWKWTAEASFAIWLWDKEAGIWRKSEGITCRTEIELDGNPTASPLKFGESDFASALQDAGLEENRGMYFEVEVERVRGELCANASLVNATPERAQNF
jgi:hypothetical protein